jgi:hypothetical protein
MIRLALCLALFLAASASANERGYSVTDFDRIRVTGPFKVTLETGKAPSARAAGSPQAIERLSVQVQGRTLVISPNRNAWGGWSGKTPVAASIKLTTPGLREASVDGSGSLTVSRMRGLRLVLAQQGASELRVGQIETDRLDMGAYGTGRIIVAGTTKQLSATSRGIASIDASQLSSQDLTLGWESAGEAQFSASRTAKVTATGSGNVTISGKSTCTVNATGSGDVRCGAKGSDQ